MWNVFYFQNQTFQFFKYKFIKKLKLVNTLLIKWVLVFWGDFFDQNFFVASNFLIRTPLISISKSARFILNILSILYLNVDFEILIQSLNLIFRLIIGRDIKKKIMIILMTLKLQNMHGRNTSSSMNLSLLHFSRVNSNPQYSASPVTKSLGHLRPSCICLSHQHLQVNVHYR